jgi:polyphosphate kinase 2 (PPK2 family)
MLEKLNLDVELSKEEYKNRWPALRDRLYDLQRACWENGIPSMIVFEGWDAAGKGTTINKITTRLDPRGFKLHAIQAPRTVEQHMPWLWRFWLKVPNYGEMAIFDRSWYGRVVVERVEKLIPKDQWMDAYKDIVDFERTLADDGYILIKFFLHISKKEQRRRFKAIEKDPQESWHVQPEDWEHHRKYDKYLTAIEEMLERTETEWGPWTIVEATDRRYEQVKVIETIIRRLEEALQKKGIPLPIGEDAGAPSVSGEAETQEASLAAPAQAPEPVSEPQPKPVLAKRSHHKKPAATTPASKPPVETWENEGGAPVEGSTPSHLGGENGQPEPDLGARDNSRQGRGQP